MLKFLFMICLSYMFSTIQSTIISTTTGSLRGRFVCDDVLGASYYSYEGIPYAEPPLGDLRFRPPVPKKPWPGVLDVSKPGCVCPQQEEYQFDNVMSEDCLFLNVFVPARNSTELFPVIIHIHSSNLIRNSGNAEDLCGPQIIVNYNIILVTMNYRLGALGFLSLDNNDATGNAGMKDVLLAIKWVKENIENFGGNPNLITIMGQGAGASIGHTLLLTDQTTDLFQGAILLGGSALSLKHFQRNSREVALQLCAELGLNTSTSTNNLLRELKKQDAFAIVEAQQIIADRNPQIGFRIYIPFGITVEIENPTAIITRKPIEIIKEGIKQNIPIVTGYDNQGGLEIISTLRQNPTGIINRLNRNPELLIPSDISGSPTFRKNLAMAIREFYFNNEDISIPTTQNYINLLTDTLYGYNIDSWIKIHTRRVDSAPLYYYIFDFDGPLNWYKIANNITYPGAGPSDGLGYLFVTQFTRPILLNSNSNCNLKTYINIAMNPINNFVRFRNPTPTPFADGYSWPEAGPNRGHLTGFTEFEFINRPPYPKRLNFWYYVYAQYYYTQQRTPRSQLSRKTKRASVNL